MELCFQNALPMQCRSHRPRLWVGQRGSSGRRYCGADHLQRHRCRIEARQTRDIRGVSEFFEPSSLFDEQAQGATPAAGNGGALGVLLAVPCGTSFWRLVPVAAHSLTRVANPFSALPRFLSKQAHGSLRIDIVATAVCAGRRSFSDQANCLRGGELGIKRDQLGGEVGDIRRGHRRA